MGLGGAPAAQPPVAQLEEEVDVNRMVSSDDLDGFPGSPFHQNLVDAAVASIRAEAGWHIAPTITETIRINAYGGPELLLPSLRVVSVSEVRCAGGVLTGWVLEGDVLRRRMYRNIYGDIDYNSNSSGDFSWLRGGQWPVNVVDVDLTHGFNQVPPELLPVIAGRIAGFTANPTLASESTTEVEGPYQLARQVTYRDNPAHAPELARYSVKTRVA